MASSSTGQASRSHFSLDTPSAIPLNSRESYLRGWFVPDDGPSYNLWLIAGETRIPVFTNLPRPDVLHHHKSNPAFADSGFLVRFDRRAPQASIKLIAEADGRETILADDIDTPDFGKVYEPGADSSCRSWLANVEPSLFWPELEIPTRLAALSYRPLLSILLELPEAHPYLVSRCIQSVVEQRYDNWQLCVESHSSEYVAKLAGADTRIQWTSDHALMAAKGDFVLRLDYRDELHPFALLELIRVLNEAEVTDLIYADEDEIDFYGNRLRAFRKPEFDPEAFLSWNFLEHMVAVRRTALLNAVGDGEIESWDTLLRILAVPGSPKPRHIPKPLYYFRKGNPTLSPLPRESRKVDPEPLLDHLSKIGINTAVEPGLFPGSFRLIRKMQDSPQISIFVRAEDGALQHAALAASIDRQRDRVYELLGSGAQLLDSAAPPRNIARSLEEIPGDIFVFINRPLEALSHAFFEELAAQAMREDCGAVTGIALDRTGRILHSASKIVDTFAGIDFWKSDLLRDILVVRSVEALSSEFFAVKRARLEALGGLTAVSSVRMPELARHLTDLSRSGNFRVLVTPYAVATFDIDGDWKMDVMDDLALPANPEPDPAVAERNLAVAQLREIAAEANRMRREMAAMQETILRLEVAPRVADLERQVQKLTAALEAERSASAQIRSSRLWRLAQHLRACFQIVRGKS